MSFHPFKAAGRLGRNAHLWAPGYVSSHWRRPKSAPTRVWLAFADHFEPRWHNAGQAQAEARVEAWRTKWPEIAKRHLDSAGRRPVYTFFYPQEEYHPRLLDPLAELTSLGIADVEVHLHHDGEGEQDFVDRITGFTETLFRRHGLLRTREGRVVFGFIHGNWALDNSLPDGRWCGLNNEITLLRDLGCYADFTLPSAPSETQTRIVNTIYWAVDDPAKPKSHDTGIPVTPGGDVAGDLLMIPGPLGVCWRSGRLLPRIENGELASYYPVTTERVRTWLRVAPRIGEDVFIKLFSHGATEKNAAALLHSALDFTLRELTAECGRRGMGLYFVSAFQMREAIESLRKRENPVERVVRAEDAVGGRRVGL
jgi:hypothetical protein